MHIRLATHSDATAVSQLVSSLAAKYSTVDFSAEGARTLLSSMEPAAIGRYLASGYRYHVAEEAGVIVGIVGTRDNAHLYHLFVVESHHRRGVATALWRVARDACITAGNPGKFTVNSSRYARPLYQKLGFVAAGPEDEGEGVFATPMRLTENAPHGSLAGEREVPAQPRPH
jgi:GNAT superfamily N-acetyltransferase